RLTPRTYFRSFPRKRESRTRLGSPRSRGRAEWSGWEFDENLLCSDAHLGGGGAHLGVDLLFVFDEIFLEHTHQLARGLIERRLILPGLHRIEQVRLDSRH